MNSHWISLIIGRPLQSLQWYMRAIWDHVSEQDPEDGGFWNSNIVAERSVKQVNIAWHDTRVLSERVLQVEPSSRAVPLRYGFVPVILISLLEPPQVCFEVCVWVIVNSLWFQAYFLAMIELDDTGFWGLFWLRWYFRALVDITVTLSVRRYGYYLQWYSNVFNAFFYASKRQGLVLYRWRYKLLGTNLFVRRRFNEYYMSPCCASPGRADVSQGCSRFFGVSYYHCILICMLYVLFEDLLCGMFARSVFYVTVLFFVWW